MLLGEDGECFSSHMFINREIIALLNGFSVGLM